MKPSIVTLVILAFVPVSVAMTGALAGQTAPVTIPKLFAGTFSRTNILSPFGRTKFFGQTWYRGDSLPSVLPITHVGWRTGPVANSGSIRVRIEIVLDNSKVVWGGLSKTFAANLNKPTTFYKMKTLSVPAASRNPNPNRPTNWIPGDQLMIYLGPNMIVQTDIQTNAAPANTGYHVEGYSTGSVRLHTRGTSCGSSVLRASYAGGQYSLTVTGAPAGAPVLFHLGLENQRSAGATLPADLSLIGMTNCKLHLDPLIALNVPADASGRATLSAPLPLPPSSLFAFVQASHPQPGANPANYVATNMAGAIFGGRGISTYVYNWTRFSPTAQFGPFTTNRGQVMLFK